MTGDGGRGRSGIPPAVVGGVRAIRWMALSPALTVEDVRVFWESLRELAAGVADAGTQGR